jgi:glycosyltransferase involved in cell wall biosynthesis
MKAIIVHQRIVDNDPIGNDIINMYAVLQNSGYEVYVYCDILVVQNMRRADRNLLTSIIADEYNLVVYHHSNYWKVGEEILSEVKARIIFKYHKITPEHYFREYDQLAAVECKLGREMTERIVRDHKNAYWIVASTYNLQDIEDVCDSHKTVIPSFTGIDKWKSIMPDTAILKRLLESKESNILIIGPVVPGNGHKFIVEVLRDYIEHYDRKILFNVIGSADKQNNYVRELSTIISRLGLSKYMQFKGEVNEQTMLAYYLGSDIYLSGVENEGFCVPIVKAQFCYLPVVARNTSSIAETLGPKQVLLAEDVCEYSSAIKLICSTTAYRDSIVEIGYKNYKTRFTNSIIAGQFKNVVSMTTGVHN